MTKLKYLEDTYLFNSQANIIKCGENEFWKYIILDSTIFYPQWWGQPTDAGSIVMWKNIFSVHMVRLDINWVVYHYGEYVHTSNCHNPNYIGKNACLQIDSENRMINSINHTAWHLIDIAVQNIWLQLTATKGFHFQSGSYIEYSWHIEDLNKWDTKINIINKLNRELEKLISQNLNIIIEDWKSDTSTLNSPEWKSYRFVYFEWYKNLWCGCGWTHIRTTWELWRINVRKIRVKKGVIKVSYEL